MLHIKRIAKNKARIVLPRHCQFILDLESGDMERVKNKPFPTEQEIDKLAENKVLEGLFDLYDMEEEAIK